MARTIDSETYIAIDRCIGSEEKHSRFQFDEVIAKRVMFRASIKIARVS